LELRVSLAGNEMERRGWVFPRFPGLYYYCYLYYYRKKGSGKRGKRPEETQPMAWRNRM
jgi:hypothetical protein